MNSSERETNWSTETWEEFRRLKKFAEGLGEVFLQQKHVVGVGVSQVVSKTGKKVFCIQFSVDGNNHNLPYRNGDLIDGVPVKIEIVGKIVECNKYELQKQR